MRASGSDTFRAVPTQQDVVASWKIVLFFLSIIAPFFINIGSISLPPYRALLLVTLIPTGIAWMSGKYGKPGLLDWMVVGFTIWASLSFFKVHGVAKIYQQVGFTIIETMGAYLLGRALIRNAPSFHRFVRIQFITILVLLPLALIETQTGDPIILTMLQGLIQTHPIITYEPRLGLERAQTIFQHPIVYGIYVASSFGLVFFALSPSSTFAQQVRRGAIIVVATVCSVSSGAFMALILQWILMGYDWVLRSVKARWRMFAIAFAILYLGIDLLSNRTPFHVFVTYLALDTSTAYNRILIFTYGSQVVKSNPIFGIGINDWPRPFWMSPSVDNFWLLMAMRHGYPGLILSLGFFAVLIRKLSRTVLHDRAKRLIRQGILISLGGLLVAAATVHLWGPIYVWVYFLAGASIWLLDPDPEPATDDSGEAAPQAEQPQRASRFTRFAPRHHRGGPGAASGASGSRLAQHPPAAQEAQPEQRAKATQPLRTRGKPRAE